MKPPRRGRNPRAARHWVSVDTPDFSSPAEGSAWWNQHTRQLDLLLERAAKAGALERVPARPVREQTRPTTLRLLARDIAEARRQAASKGLPYQTYLKMLVHEALQQKAG